MQRTRHATQLFHEFGSFTQEQIQRLCQEIVDAAAKTGRFHQRAASQCRQLTEHAEMLFEKLTNLRDLEFVRMVEWLGPHLKGGNLAIALDRVMKEDAGGCKRTVLKALLPRCTKQQQQDFVRQYFRDIPEIIFSVVNLEIVTEALASQQSCLLTKR